MDNRTEMLIRNEHIMDEQVMAKGAAEQSVPQEEVAEVVSEDTTEVVEAEVVSESSPEAATPDEVAPSSDEAEPEVVV